MPSDKKLAEVLSALSEYFNAPQTPASLRLYKAGLAPLSDEQLEAAASHIIRTRKYAGFPKVAEFLEAVMPNVEAEAYAAWEKIVGAISRHGAYTSPLFDDPIIYSYISTYVATNGERGWVGLCHESVDKAEWVRKEFISKYYPAHIAQRAQMPCKRLMGILEGDGLGRPERVIVGDPVKAQALLERTKQADTLPDNVKGLLPNTK